MSPNGGPDCCGNCAHNKAVQEMAHPHPDQPERFWELSHCTLRDVKVPNCFWTYCYNFSYGDSPPGDRQSEKPAGWIFGSGLYEGYLRIPWHGTTEPQVSVPCDCLMCGRSTLHGITISHDGSTLGFCTNRHYVDWWKTVHEDSTVTSDHMATPEEFFKEEE